MPINYQPIQRNNAYKALKAFVMTLFLVIGLIWATQSQLLASESERFMAKVTKMHMGASKGTYTNLNHVQNQVHKSGHTSRKAKTYTPTIKRTTISAATPSPFSFSVTTSNTTLVQDFPVLLTASELLKAAQIVSRPSGKVLALTLNNRQIPCQLDDINQDGIYDEFAFVFTAPAGPASTSLFTATWVNPEEVDAALSKRTTARLGVSDKRDDAFKAATTDTRPADWLPQTYPTRYQLEGPGWENDKVAFRSYFDSRNGKDIFGKKVPDLMIAQIGIPKTPLGDYHTEKPWGMDILKVGTSLGAGALGFVKAKDTLLPLSEVDKSTYTLIADGTVRSIIRLDNMGAVTPHGKVNVFETISIWAGQPWYLNDVVVTNQETNSNLSPRLQLATGIVTLKAKPETSKRFQENTGAALLMATYGLQSENNDNLGMALIVPQGQVGYIGNTPAKDAPVTATSYVTFKSGMPIQHFSYAFVSGWAPSDKAYQSAEGFMGVVRNQATMLTRTYMVKGGKLAVSKSFLGPKAPIQKTTRR